MRVASVLLVIAACGDSQRAPDAPPPSFHLHIDVGWSSRDTPQITGVTIDGMPLPEATSFSIDETFDSYVDATGSYAPRSVVITTSAGSSSDTVRMEICSTLMQTQIKALGRLIEEKDSYRVGTNQVDWVEGTCTGIDGSIVGATLRARTR